MAFIYFRRSERTRLEAYSGLLVVLVVFAFPMAWWLKTVLVFTIAAIAIHLIFTSRKTVDFSIIAKLGISAVAIAIIGGVTWSQMHKRNTHEGNTNDTLAKTEQPKQPIASRIVQGVKNIPGLISGSAQTNQKLQADTANVVKQLREFQKE